MSDPLLIAPVERIHTDPITQRSALRPFVIALAVVGLLGLLFWPHTVDDSYITYRYARNVAAGHGAVYNVGEKVEGYSCPAWMLTLALLTKVDRDLVWIPKLLGLMSAFALVVLLRQSLIKARCSAGIASWGSLWMASIPTLYVYCCSGMETVPFALALAAATFIPTMVTSARALGWLLPLAIVAVATLRPEGAVLAAVLTAFWFWTLPRKRIRITLAFAWLILLGLLGWRHAYYGSLLPNTYFAKPGPASQWMVAGDFSVLLRGLSHSIRSNALPALTEWGGLALLFLIVLGVAFWRSVPAVRASALVAFTGVILVCLMPQDWMLGHRRAFPFVAPFIFLATLGADRLRRVTGENARLLKTAALVTMCLGVAGGLAKSVGILKDLRSQKVVAVFRAQDTYLAIGEWLRRHSQPDDRLLAYEIGAVGYASGLHVIDHEGLASPAVAQIVYRAGGYGPVRMGKDLSAMQRIMIYCEAQRPDWFLVSSISPTELHEGEPAPLGVSDEPIQNAFIESFGGNMIVARWFDLGHEDTSEPHRYILLKRRNRG